MAEERLLIRRQREELAIIRHKLIEAKSHARMLRNALMPFAAATHQMVLLAANHHEYRKRARKAIASTATQVAKQPDLARVERDLFNASFDREHTAQLFHSTLDPYHLDGNPLYKVL